MPGIRTILTLAALALGLSQAFASTGAFVSGADLMDACRPARIDPVYRLKVAECRGYVVGVADSFDCRRPSLGFTWDSRNKVSQEELVNTVLSWLDAHPENGRYGASGLVAAALGDAFPCK